MIFPFFDCFRLSDFQIVALYTRRLYLNLKKQELFKLNISTTMANIKQARNDENKKLDKI
jgi:hypothetical protein